MKKALAFLLAAVMLAAPTAVLAEDVGLVLADTSYLTLDRASGYIDGIDGEITAAELAANFAVEISVIGSAGGEKTGNTPVATDDAVTCGSDSLKALIYGDVDRNGRINLADVIAVLKYIAGWGTGISADAANVDTSSEAVDLADATKLLKYAADFDDISLGDVRMVFENRKLDAEYEDSAMELFFETSLRKLGRSETESTGEYSYKMKLARNETESCQFFLTATEMREGLTAELTDFVHESGRDTLEGEILREYYYAISLYQQLLPLDITSWDSDYYAEPLLPNRTSFEVMADASQGFVINVTADKDALAGMYKSRLDIKNEAGQVIKTADVYAYVWDFTLPDMPRSASAFGINRGEIVRYGSSPEYTDFTDQYKVYYDFLLDYKLTPAEMPYDILDSRADEYMDDPRVTSFRTVPELAEYALTDFFGNGNIKNVDWDPEATGAKLVATMNKVNSKPEWAWKSYFTILDEPYDLDMFNRIKNVDDWMKGYVEDFNLMLCMATNGVYSQSPFIDLVDFVQPYLDIWCPQSPAYTLHDDKTPRAYRWNINTRSYRERGNYIDRIDTISDEGDRQWWYICCAPEIPYPNYFNFYHGTVIRVLMWQQFMFNVEGILYWDTTSYWSSFSKYVYGGGNGDGMLLYPGNFYGFNGEPIASYRLMCARDGFDDYDYLSLAEEVAGRAAVDEVIGAVTVASLDYTEDPDVLEASRDAIAELILRGKKS